MTYHPIRCYITNIPNLIYSILVRVAAQLVFGTSAYDKVTNRLTLLESSYPALSHQKVKFLPKPNSSLRTDRYGLSLSTLI